MPVNGEIVAVIGRICADRCVLDTTGVSAQPGDVVTVLGEGLSLRELEITADTIGCDPVCHVGGRGPRISE